MQNPLLGGRYRRDRPVGRGAMGEVWLAYDQLLDRPVAVKTVTAGPALTSLATPVRDDQLQRIMREARLAARINHPNAVAVYDLVLEDGQPNVVMEYVPGRTFADEIRTSGVLAPQRVAEVGAAVAGALAEAHELDITHRDVKPANILISSRGVPKLADFGVAKVNSDAGMTVTGVMLGTPAFVSPEVAQGSAANAASDIWSLGATLYAGLRGRSPFQQTAAEDVIVVLGRLISLPVPPLQAGPVSDVVMRMLDRNPARRPSAASAKQLLLDAARHGVNIDPTYLPPFVPAPMTAAPNPSNESSARWSQPTELRNLLAPPGPAAARPRRQGRAAALVAATAVLLAVLVAGAVVLLTHQSSDSSNAAQTRASAAPGPVVTVTAAVAVPPVVANTSVPDTSAPGTETSEETQATTASFTYSAPGSITVDAPAGWSEDDFFHVARTREYVEGGDHFVDAYIHLGIGNAKTLPDWDREVSGAVAALSANPQYTDVRVQPPTAVSFRGTDRAADISFTETNVEGVPRRAVERIWSEGGRTYIIQLNTPANEWSTHSQVFAQMTETCDIAS